MNKKEQLTIIIPFLNEGEEVRNTVKSIRENSDINNVVILLINDASRDGYDYPKIAIDYHTEYILNDIRLGVASSRNLGVRESHTPYIMFLDAHMRFYNHIWVDRIISELENDPKALLCCQTQALAVIDNEVVINKKRPVSYGTCIEIYNEEHFFEHHWLFEEDKETKHLNTIFIPCIMGAAYACTKEYWSFLKGLDGLMYYGNDESYISIKVWLNGGSCKLLKDVTVGHIYRDSPPYIVENAPRVYNRLLIAEVLLPYYHRVRIFSLTKALYKSIFKEAMGIIYQNREKIYCLKRYYEKILKHDFSYYEQLNNRFNTFKSIVSNKDELLKNIANYIILNNNIITEIGLLNGKLGIVLFLFHYARYSDNDLYNQFAETILEDIFDNISIDISFDFCDGLSGIGWGIEYLYQNKFIDGDINEILEEFDRKALGIDIQNETNMNLDFGLGGILCYVLARLYTIKKENKNNPFTDSFLTKLYSKVKDVIDNGKDTDCIDLFIRYSLFSEKLSITQQSSIYDITYLAIPQDYQIRKFVLGLKGSAGVGLKLIFEEFK